MNALIEVVEYDLPKVLRVGDSLFDGLSQRKLLGMDDVDLRASRLKRAVIGQLPKPVIIYGHELEVVFSGFPPPLVSEDPDGEFAVLSAPPPLFRVRDMHDDPNVLAATRGVLVELVERYGVEI